jgi:hypothetical protein
MGCKLHTLAAAAATCAIPAQASVGVRLTLLLLLLRCKAPRHFLHIFLADALKTRW